MTPASVDGGPAHEDTCPWCGAGIEYHSNCDGPREEWPPEEEARVWLTCPNEDCPVQPSTLVCKTLEEADAAWARRPTTRDAALREEGRADARVMLIANETGDLLAAAREEGRAEGLREAVKLVEDEIVNGIDRRKSEFYPQRGDVRRALTEVLRRLHLLEQPTHDASQGSAPVDEKP